MLDDAAEMAVAQRCAKRYGRHLTVTSRETARSSLPSGGWAALLVGLPDATDIVALARSRGEWCPALVVAKAASPTLLERCFDLRAAVLVKPVDAARIDQFFAAAVPRFLLRAVLQDWTMRYALSPSEADILHGAVRGQSRESIASSRGTSPLTVKKQVATFLKRTGDGTLHDAVARILRTAIGRSGSPFGAPPDV